MSEQQTAPLYDEPAKDRCYCVDCGVELPRGYRETFTACDSCWDIKYGATSKNTVVGSAGDVTVELKRDPGPILFAVAKSGGTIPIRPETVPELIRLLVLAYAHAFDVPVNHGTPPRPMPTDPGNWEACSCQSNEIAGIATSANVCPKCNGLAWILVVADATVHCTRCGGTDAQCPTCAVFQRAANDPDLLASTERGHADVEAGRVVPLDVVICGSELRATVAKNARLHNDTAAEFLALHDDVSIAQIHRGDNIDEFWFRFVLPTGAELDWEPSDGWDGPSTAMDAMAAWVELLLERGRG